MIGAKLMKMRVSSFSTASSMSSSEVIHCWQALSRFTALGVGRKITSDSGSGATKFSRRNDHSPSVLAFAGRIPVRSAASWFLYLSSPVGSRPDSVIDRRIAREASGATKQYRHYQNKQRCITLRTSFLELSCQS